MTSEKTLTLTAQDGHQIAARLYPVNAPRSAVFIFGAMGVPQSYYRALAKFLNHHGHVALTFDPRGMGESRSGSLKDLKTDILTWGRLDAAAALKELTTHYPDLPVNWLGHSLGGQVIPVTPGHERVSKFITVASGSGWWRESSPELKRRVWLLWYGLAPVLTPLFGYFPGEKLKMVGNLPRGVIEQWRRWCLHPQYLMGVEGEELKQDFHRLQTPMTSLSFTDDEMMSAASIEVLHSFYAQASKKMLRFSPRDFDRQRIGHFGFFRPEMKDLWEKLLLPELTT